MTNTRTPDPVVVGINLDGTIAAALDQAAGEILSSRAGFVRRVLAESLRASGHLPPVAGPRTLKAGR